MQSVALEGFLARFGSYQVESVHRPGEDRVFLKVTSLMCIFGNFESASVRKQAKGNGYLPAIERTGRRDFGTHTWLLLWLCIFVPLYLFRRQQEEHAIGSGCLMSYSSDESCMLCGI